MQGRKSFLSFITVISHDLLHHDASFNYTITNEIGSFNF